MSEYAELSLEWIAFSRCLFFYFNFKAQGNNSHKIVRSSMENIASLPMFRCIDHVCNFFAQEINDTTSLCNRKPRVPIETDDVSLGCSALKPLANTVDEIEV